MSMEEEKEFKRLQGKANPRRVNVLESSKNMGSVALPLHKLEYLCPSCGSRDMMKTWRYCPHCGQAIRF